MSQNHLDRRNFARLSLAAFGGLLTGASAIGQTTPAKIPAKTPAKGAVPAAGKASAGKAAAGKAAGAKDADAKSAKADDKAKTEVEAYDPSDAPHVEHSPVKKEKIDWPPKEIHICRGLNTCKGKGRSGDNQCAGRGDCATTKNAPHGCSTKNACKGQGGCNGMAGKNTCEGKGDGSVPLVENFWPAIRKEFERKRTILKKPFGDAPPSVDEERQEAERIAREAKAKADLAAEQGETAEPVDPKKPRQGARRTTARTTGSSEKATPKGTSTKETPKATASKTADGKTPRRTVTKPANKPAKEEGDSLLDELLGDENDKKGADKKGASKSGAKGAAPAKK